MNERFNFAKLPESVQAIKKASKIQRESFVEFDDLEDEDHAGDFDYQSPSSSFEFLDS